MSSCWGCGVPRRGLLGRGRRGAVVLLMMVAGPRPIRTVSSKCRSALRFYQIFLYSRRRGRGGLFRRMHVTRRIKVLNRS